MLLPKKCIAINTLFLCVLFLTCGSVWAAPLVGSVINMSGHLLSKKADGTVKVLSLQSPIEEGDTLVTEKDTYVRIKFIDNSEITLQPNTQFKIENFAYSAEKPEGDNIVFGLLKGGLRAITGLLGKRSRDRFSLKTPAATIGIRGTIFVADYVPPAVQNEAPVPASSPTPGSRAPGLYVQVLDGMIRLSNGGGSQNFSAGQFGFTPNLQRPPVIVPANPGMQFNPPPAFSAACPISWIVKYDN